MSKFKEILSIAANIANLIGAAAAVIGVTVGTVYVANEVQPIVQEYKAEIDAKKANAAMPSKEYKETENEQIFPDTATVLTKKETFKEFKTRVAKEEEKFIQKREQEEDEFISNQKKEFEEWKKSQFE